MRRVSWVWKPMAIMAASRVAAYLAIWLGCREIGLTAYDATGRWDGSYYLRNAFLGWPDRAFQGGKLVGEEFAFFPLVSLVMRFLRWATPMGEFEASTATMLVFALAAAVLLWRLVREVADEGIADRAVLLFAWFPGSVALTFVYAEGVMLTTAMACLLLLHRRQWVGAGVAAALCTASRPNAIVIVACCAWAALVAIRGSGDWKALVAPLLAPLGAVAYHLWIWNVTGSVTTWWRVEHEGWGSQINVFNIVDRIDYLASHIDGDLQGWSVVLGTVVTVVGLVLLVKDRAPTLWLIWAFGICGLAFVSPALGMRPRFVLTAFPLFVPYARRLQGTVLSSVVGVSAALFVLGMVLLSRTVFLVP